jgi:hypothetical protein
VFELVTLPIFVFGPCRGTRNEPALPGEFTDLRYSFQSSIDRLLAFAAQYLPGVDGYFAHIDLASYTVAQPIGVDSEGIEGGADGSQTPIRPFAKFVAVDIAVVTLAQIPVNSRCAIIVYLNSMPVHLLVDAVEQIQKRVVSYLFVFVAFHLVRDAAVCSLLRWRSR